MKRDDGNQRALLSSSLGLGSKREISIVTSPSVAVAQTTLTLGGRTASPTAPSLPPSLTLPEKRRRNGGGGRKEEGEEKKFYSELYMREARFLTRWDDERRSSFGIYYLNTRGDF